MKKNLSILIAVVGYILTAHAEDHKILFFSKSSGFEHEVISWEKGQPSFAEKILMDIGEKHGWDFEFSKDGSKFSPDYLAQFDTVIFYTTGDLTKLGNDKQPPMTPEGKQALFDYVRGGKGFIGLHCASDTFHTTGEDGKDSDEYIRFLGGEFVAHGAQQEATNRVINPEFPGFENAGESFTLMEEWYCLKNFAPDIHCLTVIESNTLKGSMYQRSHYPTSWARPEGKGRIYYNAMGHREDIWTNDLFKDLVIGAVKWTTGEVYAEIPSNLVEVAPDAMKLTEPPKAKEKKK